MKNYEEKASLCALGKIFGFEPKVATALITQAGSACGVFRMSTDETEALLGPYSKYREKITEEAVEKAAKELKDLKDKGISYCGWTEEQEYPPLLKECEDPPVGLYIRSETEIQDLWAPQRKIAIVGTRDISPYGREWCERIVMGLGSSGAQPAIISGLALGTDICAHRAALSMGLPTIGVMATGPEQIYPHQNESTARLMVKTPGCALVTDYPPGTHPLAAHFLRRNRIIAGLAEATLLIESKIKGGGIMTSRLAFSYNRDVYALPGRVDDICSLGCNELIRCKIAEPLTSVSALLDGLGIVQGGKRRQISENDLIRSIYRDSMDEERLSLLGRLLTLIRSNRGIMLEDLATAAELPYHEAANLCSLMESDGIISIDLLQRCSINAKII